MKYLGKIRRSRGLTQAELAQRVGVGENSIARYERNEMTPSLRIGHAIAEVLGVSEAELLRGPAEEDWVLEIKAGGKEVINMDKAIGCISSVNCGSDGAVLTLGGRYETFQDETKFEGLIAQLRAARGLILQNGESLKEINKKGKEAGA